MPTRISATAALLTVMTASAGCEEAEAGTPPTLESITLSGDDVELGKLSVVTGSGQFTDPDGDVEEADIELLEPNGNTVSLTAPLTGVEGQTEAPFAIQLQILANDPGTYEATFVLVDGAGNESEPVTASFDVAAEE